MVRVPAGATRTHQSPLINAADRYDAKAAGRLDIRYCPRILLPVGAQLLLLSVLWAMPLSAQRTPVSDQLVRPCKADQRASRKPAKPKWHAEAVTDSGSACLEVRSTSLGVQEYLQSFLRQQRWRVSDEDAQESLWSFRVHLTAEELLGYAKPDSTTQRMSWTSGRAVVLVKTADLGDGYTRTIVSAHFEGYGEPDDALATRRTSWALGSNGKLETALINGLRERLRSKE
jgi:hypothetical protein